ncbi:MAG TPA: hypothetical protein VKZ53_12925 [Candidatus Angelobacter sp.]|nr:hypothetical protein [Candidatus Angelobacter sp.]
MSKISVQQLRRLQTLWTQYARHDVMAQAAWMELGQTGDRDAAAASRERRLAWASAKLKKRIASFSDLSVSDATDLINCLQDEMGIPETSPPKGPRRASRIKDRDRAHAAGTEGRRFSNKVGDAKAARAATMASESDLEMISRQVQLMGWTSERLTAFLCSSSSPLGKRQDTQLRTLGDCNRVLWALRRISRRQDSQEASS